MAEPLSFHRRRGSGRMEDPEFGGRTDRISCIGKGFKGTEAAVRTGGVLSYAAARKRKDRHI